ncbi:2-phosphoxylose phosphatase 1 [Biomphalaria glabrata]|nr:2-phosphoxylose phosphatase 1 [Biomphalaria glabrata]
MFYKRLNRLLSLRNIIIIGTITLIFTFFKLIYSGDLNSENSNHPFARVSEQIQQKPKTMEIDWYDDSGHRHEDARPPLSVARIAKYCNHPRGEPSGEEGLVPKDYVLLNAHVVIRHGDRSPISKLPDGKHQNISCLTDVTQFAHVPKLYNYVHVMASVSQDRSKESPFKMWGMYPAHSVCADGQLTGLGAIQHVLNGIHFSERYHYQHKLFNENNWQDKVVAYSTEVSRTYQSAIAFLYGLLPKFEFDNINLKRANNINFCEYKFVGTTCFCQGLENVYVRAGQECRAEMGYMSLMKRYKNLTRHLSDILGIQEHKLQWPTSLMDGLSSFACHRAHFPCNANRICLTSRDIEAVWEPVDYLSNCLNKSPKYISFAKVSMFGLLKKIVSAFEMAIHNGSGPSFHLYSGHDTTVSPLIATLGLEDGLWPGYATRIVFELYSRLSSKDYFFRVLQNGNVVTSEVVFCKGLTNGGFCNLEHFFKYFGDYTFDQLCHSVLASIKSQ